MVTWLLKVQSTSVDCTSTAKGEIFSKKVAMIVIPHTTILLPFFKHLSVAVYQVTWQPCYNVYYLELEVHENQIRSDTYRCCLGSPNGLRGQFVSGGINLESLGSQ